ncbi:MAG: thioredoxin domain-containing protein [Rhizomicrobium sp.]
MTGQWKFAALGALVGAAIAVGIVFGAAATGYFPTARVDGRQVRAYLLAHPQIFAEIQERYAALQERQADVAEGARQAAVDTAGAKAFFDPAVAYVTGPANAKISLVEFFDYNCVHCRNTFPTIKAFYEAHKDNARFAFVDFPIFGKMSTAAARAAVAARRQPDKYVPFSFALMSEPGAIDLETLMRVAQASGLDMTKLIADMKDPATDKTLAAARALAKRVSVDGTPTFIVNGKVHSGEIDEDTLKQMTGT